ncbi:MAG: site-specific DNA-methyltransferase, partial [Pseudomonadota bacterium]|nr:site-specific DNA-methyltransferase [Pseudomonadota bacterium]
IDDNEAANLKLVCDEIFGLDCFMGNLIWKSRVSEDSRGNSGISVDHEYIFCYAKRNAVSLRGAKKDLTKFSNPDNDTRGMWRSADMTGLATKEKRPNLHYEIVNPETGVSYPCPVKGWRFDRNTMNEKISSGRIIWPSSPDGRPRQKMFLSDMGSEFKNFSSVIYGYSTRDGSREINSIVGSGIFDFPKPSSLISEMISQVGGEDVLILDFFAGSGTTMQAVMELNLEDGGNRQCICVQIPEKLDEKTEAYKAGYRSIADITRARIDKVIEKLKAEQPEKTQGLACAQFTLASSNFKQWRSDVEADALRAQLEMFQQSENAAPQSTDAQTAMLAELLLKMGLGALGVQAISKAKTVAGVTVHRVLLEGGRQIWLCFEPYQDALKDAIAKDKPAQVVMLNSCFAGDKADEQLANLQLELQGLDIGLTVV